MPQHVFKMLCATAAVVANQFNSAILTPATVCSYASQGHRSNNVPGTAAGAPPPQVDMAQRFVVIRCLRAQCESGQLLVDLFVNYDCDLEGQNLFERMVLALVRLAQGTTPTDVTAQVIAEEQAMRLAVSHSLLAFMLHA